ncbi:MAG: hypothetical protein B0D88_08705 [Candidatus Sedimenticola endophacoides]|uniref:Fibronectin type-III domain-containing protein n=1 Tax=Candidatus Sedimenticola endophacoides TaxID=2548426 RepID=A0A6N4DL02_9GAMM|nr:MAG: hypothetical protein B0D94_01050 [Candidatus Sedimenticola endophacoides]OQX40325.1 MAG: hypothetical protein B0D88_08705 [Candidatus Sedimenticola endophacoides]OQX42955.1 MAG: hypothetical protein B0D89_00250 [Candidatus Sedimenticola endophacoides]PUD98046.1 MAG: hypothetical protein C3L26_13850 [Candidatus Sedimenticola endophacoides]PUD98818.1 MAG: hypothetical protein C3L24_12020 [Candidatus Sedimenticola endophacoides]
MEHNLTTQTELSPVQSLSPGNYFWRLTSIRANGEAGPPGSPWRLEIKAPPAIPEPEPPAIEDDRLSFRWRGAEDARFEVQMARDAAFTDLVHQQVTHGPAAQMDKPGAGSYHIRIRGFDNEGEAGEFSDPQRIEVPLPRWVPPTLTFGTLLLLAL